MSEWSDYPGDRLSKRVGEIIVIVPKEHDFKNVALFCDVCRCTLSQGDDLALKKFSCCEECANEWAYANAERWNAGWRPDLNDVKSTIERRCYRKIV
jgi:hypothetical protein